MTSPTYETRPAGDDCTLGIEAAAKLLGMTRAQMVYLIEGKRVPRARAENGYWRFSEDDIAAIRAMLADGRLQVRKPPQYPETAASGDAGRLMTLQQLEHATGVPRGTLYVWACRQRLLPGRLSDAGEYLYCKADVEKLKKAPRAKKAARLLTLRCDAALAADLQLLQSAYGLDPNALVHKLITIAAAPLKNNLTTQNK